MFPIYPPPNYDVFTFTSLSLACVNYALTTYNERLKGLLDEAELNRRRVREFKQLLKADFREERSEIAEKRVGDEEEVEKEEGDEEEGNWKLEDLKIAFEANRVLFTDLTKDVVYTAAISPPPPPPPSHGGSGEGATAPGGGVTYMGNQYGSVEHVCNHVVREYGQRGQSRLPERRAVEGGGEGEDNEEDTLEKRLGWGYDLDIWEANWTVLVPGCGLGGAAYWLSRRVGKVVLNDVSVNMVLAGRHIMKHGLPPGTYVYTATLADTVQQGEGVAERAAESITEVRAERMERDNVSWEVGDVGDITMRGGGRTFDAVYTEYFLDAVPDFRVSILCILSSLPPGGYWVNSGPLSWHASSSVRVGVSELKSLLIAAGFIVVTWEIGWEGVGYDGGETMGGGGGGGGGYKVVRWVLRKAEGGGGGEDEGRRRIEVLKVMEENRRRAEKREGEGEGGGSTEGEERGGGLLIEEL
ncbi:hypothetical protein TrCOL_g6421 [Triparma columacea]|uniref:carnosine N-methyltransferase n=1 Tax=Triparma columacea TaxID=722753 RepID=A0A9W7LF90_9STRA|nr:hypothetical protein TrCOL_g6421 [Triparma columacea]